MTDEVMNAPVKVVPSAQDGEPRRRGRPPGSTNRVSTSPMADPPEAPEPVQREEPAPRSDRPQRRPLGVSQLKLSLPPRPGYVRRWINDLDDRIEQALAGGYSHVKDSKGRNISRGVGVSPRGGGLTAYAMEIPQEWYDEDFARKQGMIDVTDHTILRSMHGASQGDGRYVPQLPGGEPITKLQVSRGGR